MSTRSRGACKGCRSKKQKCDAQKPTCSRCQSIGKPCVWPETQKRGPAKGYTEALEHRLRETEDALHRLLSATDDNTVRFAFSRDRIRREEGDRPGTESDADFSLGSGTHPQKAWNESKNSEALINHWEQFPLGTADEVKAWMQSMQNKQLPKRAVDNTGGIQGFGRLVDQSTRKAESESLVHDLDPVPDVFGVDEQVDNAALLASTTIGGEVFRGTGGAGVGLEEDFRRQYLW